MSPFYYLLIFLQNVGRRSLHHRKCSVTLVLFSLALLQWQYFYSFIKDDNENETSLKDGNETLKDISINLLKNNPNFEWPFKRFKRKTLRKNFTIDHTLDDLPHFHENVQCPILFNPSHPKYNETVKKASTWKYNVSEAEFWKKLEDADNDICVALKNKYAFFTEPLSEEEAEFPLAYGMLIVKDIRQMTYMLSAFYQPQNAYCIAIDGKAARDFKNRMKVFQQCFPNIHVFNVNSNVSWCGPEIPAVVLSCVQKLAERNHPWKYYQYLSGVDLPLKTNLEMVRIFKALNGTFNANVYDLYPERWTRGGTPPLPIWISSLSATFSREAANVMATHPKVYKLLKFLQKTYCPDESLWATLAGNPEYLKMPGGFSAKDFVKKIQSQRHNKALRTKLLPSTLPKNSFQLQQFYISRHQEWNVKENNFTGKCSGTWNKDSCIYGAGDLPILLVRPELVAHKLYIHQHPAAFFCLYHKIRERALDFENQRNFDASNYAQLPQVQLSQGKPIDDVRFFF